MHLLIWQKSTAPRRLSKHVFLFELSIIAVLSDHYDTHFGFANKINNWLSKILLDSKILVKAINTLSFDVSNLYIRLTLNNETKDGDKIGYVKMISVSFFRFTSLIVCLKNVCVRRMAS